MKRNGVPLWVLAFLLSGAAMAVQADTPDDLQDAAAVALQKLDQFAIKESARAKQAASAARDLGVQLNSVASQSGPLNDQLKNRKGELEEKIGALDEQIEKLKEQVGKLDVILEKIAQLLPHFANTAENDQGIEASQHILASIVQDRVRATRLADAIKQKSSDEVSSVLRRAFEGARVQVGAMPEGEGATVNFRIGNLVHCLSTDKRCRGAVSSLGKAESRNGSEMVMQELQSLLAAANRESALCNKTVEDVLSRLDTAQRGSAPIDANRAADLQRLMGRLSKLPSTSSQVSRDVAAAMDRIIARS
jgi:archaellum component FlaC